MKTFLGFLFLFISNTIILGQENLSPNAAGDWIGKFPKSNQLTEVFPHASIKRIDQEPNVSPVTTPVIPADAQSVGKLIEYTNLIVEKFNQDKIEELRGALIQEWKKQRDQLKYEYGEYSPSATILYATDKTGKLIEKPVPFAVWVSSGLELGPPYSNTGKKTLHSHLFVLFSNGKVTVAGGYFPLISEEYCCLLRKTPADGLQYLTFSYKDWPEKGYEKPTPWIIWTKQGEILRQEQKNLKFEDYDPTSIFTGEPKLK